MAEQLCMIAKRDAGALIRLATREHAPFASVCMFSGGNDSVVLARHCHAFYSHLFHIDTGTAAPGVREFVDHMAVELGKPLLVYEAGDAFRVLVLGDDLWWDRFTKFGADMAVDEFLKWDEETHGKGRPTAIYGQPPHGFPAPGAHGRAYTRLKERQIEALVRDLKKGHHHKARVMLLSGKRRAESKRRKRTTKGIERKGGQLYVNPLIDWTRWDMLRYRRDHDLPQSEVAAWLHRSGECNCGAFASAADERSLMKFRWPEWWAWMEALEVEAEARGLRWCRWGGYDLNGIRATEKSDEKPGNACSSCEWRDQLFEVAA